MTEKTTLVLDGDVFVYRHTSAVETPIHWGNDLWTLHSDASEAKQKLDIQVRSMKEDLEAAAVVITFSSSLNFRNSVLPTYKGNRVRRKPVAYTAVRKYCLETYRCVTLPYLEADDTMGVIATGKRFVQGRKIIVTIDKDLKAVPCNLFNPLHPEDGVVTITQEEADLNHLTQTLMGDATDGYSGCPGVGAVKAQRILAQDPTWAAVKAAYEGAGLNEEEALRQARVARICRTADYNFKQKTVRLWTP
jgi:5'-3' exonuclease